MDCFYPNVRRFGAIFLRFGILILWLAASSSSSGQCSFTSANLPILTFSALPGNCLSVGQKIPVPKANNSDCKIGWKLPNTNFVDVPLGDTTISLPAIGIGTTVVTWAFFDGGNYYGNTPQSIVIVDVDPPYFSYCPPFLNVNLKPNRCDTTLFYNTPQAVDACGLNPAAPFLITGLVSGSKFQIGSTVIIWRAKDVSGNTSQCSFTFTVNDFPTPVLSCRDTVKMFFDNTCEKTLTAGEILLGNNFGCLSKFEVKIKKTATGGFVIPDLDADDAGKFYTYQLRNPATDKTCTGKMVALDTIKPTVDCSNLVDTVFTLGALTCATLPNFSLPAANDNCTDPTFSGWPVSIKNGNFSKPFPPGVTDQVLIVSDASGNSDSCFFKITVNPYLTQQALICLGQLNVSLDATCKLELGADALLSGNNYGCYKYYDVSIYRFGNWTTNNLDSSDVGQTYPYRVFYPPTGQTCWGNILVEDKVPPIVLCQDTILECYQNADSLLLGLIGKPKVIEGCGIFNLSFSDSLQTLGCNGSKIFRTWVATDGYGNTSFCEQTITRKAGNLASVIFPKDTTLPCTFGNFPTPAIAGTPTLGGNPASQACGIGFSFVDTRLNICPGGSSYKIIRLWTATNFCTNQTVQKTQTIVVMDMVGATFPACPKDTLISSNQNQCFGSFKIPDIRLWDNCSRIKKVELKIGSFTKLAKLVNLSFPISFPNDTVARFNDTTFLLPSGFSTLLFTAFDDCGNTSTCTFKVRVRDLTTPAALCPTSWNLALSTDDPNDCYNGDVANILAQSLASGSVDDCSPIKITGQRILPVKPCINDLNKINGQDPCNDNIPDAVSEFKRATDESTSVKFYCCEAGTPIPIMIRVYQLNPDGTVSTLPNGQQIMNSCQTNITVQDVSPPACTPPPNVTLNCSAFNPSAPPAISPVTPDNCCTPTFTSKWQTPTMFCGGVNTRIFTVTDCNSNTSVCSQTVTVLYAPPSYSIKFPDDQNQVGCQNAVPTPPVVSNNTGCTKFKTIFKDSIPANSGGGGVCFKIFRQWQIFDTCVSSLPPTADFIQILNPAGAVGPTILPGNPNYNTVFNAYRFTQEINVTDNMPPEILAGCNPVGVDTLCDLTDNNPALFNVGGIFGDLCETPATLSITTKDGCAGPNVSVSFVFSLDYDINGTPDLIITSALPPAGWGLTTILGGGQKVATIQSPGGNLPQGRHTLTWSLTDQCGNNVSCAKTYIVRDCKKPDAFCKTAFSKQLQKVGNVVSVTVAANELNNGSTDNCTTAGQLIFGTRIKNSGQPFTSSLLFNCADLVSPAKTLELSVRDLAGNTSFCQTIVTITDPSNFCNVTTATVSGSISNNALKGLGLVQVDFGDSLSANIFGTAVTDTTGHFQILDLPGGLGIHVTPSKNIGILNGITTYDLLLISRHILGVTTFDEPSKFIAADINKSNSVTTNDIVELRKVILGINSVFPANTSWRFVPKYFVFPNPLNPFQTVFPEKITLDSAMIAAGNADFLAIKTGDINGNATTNFTATDDRSQLPPMFFETADASFLKSEMLLVPIQIRPGQQPGGFQMTLNFDPEILKMEELRPGSGMDFSNFGIQKNRSGQITVSWFGKTAAPSFSLIFKTLRSGRLSQILHFSDEITPREAFFKDEKWAEPMLVFGNFENENTATNSRLEVFQNQPNPFDESTEIGFFLPKSAPVALTVSTADGRILMKKLVQFERGYHVFEVKNEDLGGASGVLWYSIQTPEDRVVRKMIFEKR